MEIRRVTPAALAEYCTVPVAFEVASVFEIAGASAPFTLTERRLERSFTKDYDAIAGNGPLAWPRRFAIEEWALFSACVDGRWVGGAAVAPGAALVFPMDASPDATVLWDLRVSPANRGVGVGHALFAAAEQWARARHSRALLAETQNVNVAACRFYERQGCVLHGIDRAAYPGFPGESQFIWRKDLTAHDAGGATRR